MFSKVDEFIKLFTATAAAPSFSVKLKVKIAVIQAKIYFLN